MGRMNGKVAMVTGATSGIGTGITEVLGREGAKVAFCGRRKEEGAAEQERLRSMGIDATYIYADVTKAADMKNFAEKTVELYGTIDCVVCNSGAQRHGTAADISEEDWDIVVDTNLKGPWLTCKYALPTMMEKHSGSIVIVASMCAEHVMPQQIAYQASKAGAQMLGKAMAAEYAPYGIRCNIVRPGGTATPMAVSAMSRVPAEMKDRMEKWNKFNMPLGDGRLATIYEQAYAVLYFCSDESSYTTGASLLVDGGNTLGWAALTVPRDYDLVKVN